MVYSISNFKIYDVSLRARYTMYPLLHNTWYVLGFKIMMCPEEYGGAQYGVP